VAAGVTFALVLHALVVSNRLHPSIETGAPLAWRYSPVMPARLHRRLQTAVGLAFRSDDGGTAGDVVSSLVDHAAAVDRDLVAVNRQQGPLRRANLRRLRREVEQIEQLALRLQHRRRASQASPADGRAPAPTRSQSLDELHVRLDLLADAHDELVAIEQANTASDPDAVLRRMAAAVPPGEAVLPPPPAPPAPWEGRPRRRPA
jgi:hypothetical protein